MKKFLITFLSLLIATSAFSYPLDLNVNSKHNLPPEIEDFRYWYGDVNYGFIVYLGNKDIAGFETEFHIHFSGKKITKSVLILGPAGLDSYNCIRKYKKVVKVLNKKYGHYSYQREIKDPLVDDLISTAICAPIRLELHSVYTYWKSKNLEIIATLLGDDSGFYIEIEYVVDKKLKPSKLKKIL